MKNTFFPGFDGTPCPVQYNIISISKLPLEAVIIVRQTVFGTSLLLADEGRDNLLNRILSDELKGVRLDFIRFVVIIKDDPSAWEFQIQLNVDSYVSAGNPHQNSESVRDKLKTFVGKSTTTTIQYNSTDVVGGCAEFYTKEPFLVDPKEFEQVV